MGDLKGAKNYGPELPGIERTHPGFRTALLCQYFGSIFQQAVVSGSALKGYSQFYADDRGIRVHAFQVDLVPDSAYFLRAEGGGIKAMSTGVLVVWLTAAFAFLHSGIVAQMFGCWQGMFV